MPVCSLLRAPKINTPTEPFDCTRRFANQLKSAQKPHERKTRAGHYWLRPIFSLRFSFRFSVNRRRRPPGKGTAAPASEPRDAMHIATAVTHGVQFIATWNFTHILNPHSQTQIAGVCRDAGFIPPVIEILLPQSATGCAGNHSHDSSRRSETATFRRWVYPGDGNNCSILLIASRTSASRWSPPVRSTQTQVRRLASTIVGRSSVQSTLPSPNGTSMPPPSTSF